MLMHCLRNKPRLALVKTQFRVAMEGIDVDPSTIGRAKGVKGRTHQELRVEAAGAGRARP